MNRTELRQALITLNNRLAHYNISGEVGLYDGAVMCLALNAREGTHDIDAIFNPKMDILRIANEVGEELGLPAGWFNDGVKGFISKNNTMIPFQQMSNLSIYVASPEYMFAMKAVSCRLDVINEINDIKFLVKHLNITTLEQAERIIYNYYPKSRVQQKTIYMLMELLGGF